MTGFIPSSADEGDVELYSQGSCHVLAVALHRHLGWSFLVVTDPDSPYWEDEADADNSIPSVTHVYAVDPLGTAWDVHGARPVDDVVREVRRRHPDVLAADTDGFGTEFGLATYVDDMGEDDADRPLHAFVEADVDEAWEKAKSFLDGIPGFGSGTPVP